MAFCFLVSIPSRQIRVRALVRNRRRSWTVNPSSLASFKVGSSQHLRQSATGCRRPIVLRFLAGTRLHHGNGDRLRPCPEEEFGVCEQTRHGTGAATRTRKGEILPPVSDWCERGDSTPQGFTSQILSLISHVDNKEDQQLPWQNPAKRSRIRNPDASKKAK
jgi:hypothetical protein